MNDCLFCRIVRGELGARLVFEDEQAVAFEDIHPQAPVHVLVIPRAHLVSLNDVGADQEALAGHLLAVARTVARIKGIEGSGYRVVANTNAEAGQSVFHLHLHVMGGRRMGWPPG